MTEFLGIDKGFILSLDYIFDNRSINSYVLNKFILSLDTFANGITAIKVNSCNSIFDIRYSTDFPIIGCIERVYPNSLINITPTLNEIHELAKAGAQIIYLDASNKIRPNNECIQEFYYKIKSNFPEIKFIGEVSNLNDINNISSLNFDGISINGDFELYNSNIISNINVPIIYNYTSRKLVDVNKYFQVGFNNVIISSKFYTPYYKIGEFLENVF